MRVLIDAINNSDQIRGPDRYTIGLLRGLAQCAPQIEFLVVYAAWQCFMERLDLPSNFKLVRCTPPRQRIARVIWHALVFPGLARRLRPDVIHLANIIYVPWSVSTTVMTVHDIAHFRFPEKYGYFRGYSQRLLIRGALAAVDRVIAVSQYTRSELATHVNYPADTVTIIGEGGPEPIDVPRQTSGPRYFLYVGQLERSKNVETLIRAFSLSAPLKKAGVELWIAGKDGNAAEEIARLAAEIGDQRVRRLGYVDDSSLPALYANALGFVFPSLVEGFGLVLLEAMAYGAAIIASNASAIPEVVGDAGLLVDARNIDALQKAMETLYLDETLRNRLAALGRRRLGQFSWLKTGEDTAALYQEMAK